jgi:hypothetical protein
MALDPSSEVNRILDAATLVADCQRRLHEAFEHRAERGADQWTAAADAFRQAVAVMYPDDFWDAIERAKAGDPDAVDRALTFLEADPWCYRSGYAKQTLLRLLRQVQLTPEQTRRARRIVLQAVDVGDRREFRESCRLGRKLADDEMRSALLDRLRSADPGRARRALWVLDALREPLDEPDRQRVLQILEQSAGAAQWWRTSSWACRLARRYGDAGWFAGLLERVCAGGPDLEPAWRLLTSVSLNLSGAQRRAVGALVLMAVEIDFPSEGLEWAAIMADSAELRDTLVSAYNEATDVWVRGRAWWAINAILG